MKRIHYISGVIIFLFGLALTPAGTRAQESLRTVGEFKVGRIDGQFAMMLPVDGSTETHVIEKFGSYTIYFRHAVAPGGNARYQVDEQGVSTVLVTQTRPDVVAMEVRFARPVKIAGGKFDASRGGYVFRISETNDIEESRAKTPLELEAEAELARYRTTLSGRTAGRGARINRIVIDPGHGGFDPGAVGPGKLNEKDVVLDIARRVQRIIREETGIQAFLTRRDDYYIPLSSRTVISNKYRADLFVSIHANASENRKARGFEVYYCSETASSKEAAAVAARENVTFDEVDRGLNDRNLINIEEIVFQAGRKKLWDDSRSVCRRFFSPGGIELDVPKRGAHSANFFVLRKARMPAILVEVAYISNPSEETMLRGDAYREQVARGIVKVITGMQAR